MTEMLQKSENVANENSQDLTEKWKKGELNRNEVYYYETPFNTVDTASGYWLCNNLDTKKDKVEVLGEVPSYEEWQEYQELDEDNKRNTQLAILFSLRADIFKELLKQSRIYVKIETEDYDDRTVSKADKEKAKELLTKIDEVLK